MGEQRIHYFDHTFYGRTGADGEALQTIGHVRRGEERGQRMHLWHYAEVAP